MVSRRPPGSIRLFVLLPPYSGTAETVKVHVKTGVKTENPWQLNTAVSVGLRVHEHWPLRRRNRKISEVEGPWRMESRTLGHLLKTETKAKDQVLDCLQHN
ncbi:hypothetical protein C8R45DRAFT_513735 [Mycena sanguinolenta]|nr:hypothetical protein C8R45DRAFT_513735 [Mycena sanguinolenta]